ncbi:MAG: YkgJ family cysteine cluster protein [Thermoplasmata archaeon]
MIEIDYSEFDLLRIQGINQFACIKNCGFCCLCQPELSAEELRELRKDVRIRQTIIDELISGRKGHGFRMQGEFGACAHLSRRSCAIYDKRPRFCAQFPFHIHMSKRAQVTVDLSCRGLWQEDITKNKVEHVRDIHETAKEIVQKYPKGMFMQHYNHAKTNYETFEDNAKYESVFVSEKNMREAASYLIPILFTEDGVKKIVQAGEDFPFIEEKGEDIAKRVLEIKSDYDVDELLYEAMLFSLNVPIENAPVYLSPELEWLIFREKEGRIFVHTLEEDGKISNIRDTGLEIKDVKFDINIDEKKMFEWYMKVLVNRDAIYGNVALKVAGEDYLDPLPEIYLSTISDYVLDLCWRTWLFRNLYSSNLAISEHANSKPTIFKHTISKPVKEAIIASDMDFMDADTIGIIT